MKLLAPKYDVVFHALFKESTKDKLAKLVGAILGKEVKVLSIDRNRYMELEGYDDKFGIMDLRAELENNEQCNIEIQLSYYPGMLDRLMLYWADNFKRQLKKGMQYDELKRTISILILWDNVEKFKNLEGDEIEWKVLNTKKPQEVLTEKLDIYIIEVEKIKKLFKREPNNKIYQWMMFLDDPNSKEVTSIMKENEDISNVREDLERVSGNEELQELARLRELREHDYITFEKNKVKCARKEGFEQGVEEGIAKGSTEKSKEIAKEMLKDGMPIDQGHFIDYYKIVIFLINGCR